MTDKLKLRTHKDWYYTQIFVHEKAINEYGTHNHRTISFITFAKAKAEAYKKAIAHAKTMMKDSETLEKKDVHLYRNNYIQNALNFISQERYV